MFRNEKGASMLIAMFVVMILALLGSAVYIYSVAETKMASSGESHTKAYYLAKSGANAVAAYITNVSTSKTDVNNLIGKKSDPIQIAGVPGSFTVEVSREADSNEPDYLTITVTSVAEVKGEKATVTLVLKPSFSKSIVAVGSENKVLFSNSGLINSWMTTGGSGVNNINDVAWNGVTYVAVGVNGYLRTSVDGTTWSDEFRVSYNLGGNTYVNERTLNAVTWTGSLFVAVGENATIMTSPTGFADSWNYIPITSGTLPLKDVASNGSKIVAISNGGYLRTSENGSAWSDEKLAITSITSNYNRIFWAGGRFIILGDNQELVYSSDGEDDSWVEHVLYSQISGLNAIACDPAISTYVGVSNAGKISTSSNGIIWSAEFSSGVTTNLNDVFWAGNSFIAFGDSGVILSSSNGASGTWTRIDSGGAYNLKSAAYGGIGAIYLQNDVYGKK